MTRLALIAALAASFVTVEVSTSDARPRPAGARSRASNFESNKTFGLGIMIGAPTGLSGKYYLGPDTAIDFGLGAIGGYGRRRGIHLHVDYLWHPISLVSHEAFELPLYFGIGGRIWEYDYCYEPRGDYRCYDAGAIGARVPLGVAFDFNEVPIDIFIEIALVLDIVYHHDYYDDYDGFYVDLNAAVGVRYYFW